MQGVRWLPGFASTAGHASYCKECGGSGICERGRQLAANARSAVAHGICEHGRQRNYCEVRWREHLRARQEALADARSCGGASVCEHRQAAHGCSLCQPTGTYKDYAYYEKRKYGCLPAGLCH